jgi:hypothetical protein
VTIFESLEDDRRLIADPHAVREAYLVELHRFLTGLEMACRDGNVEHVRVSTHRPLEQTLLDFLTRRVRS